MSRYYTVFDNKIYPGYTLLMKINYLNNKITTQICKTKKKGLQIWILAIILGTIFSCNPLTNASEKESALTTNVQSKSIGNGNYVFYNYLPKKNVGQSVINGIDIEQYLENAQETIHGLVDEFSASLKGRPAAQEYFNEFITNQKNNNIKRGLDIFMANINKFSAPIMENIFRSLDDKYDYASFILCVETMNNEDYKYGLDKYFKNSQQEDCYNQEKERLLYNWTGAKLPFDPNQDIEQNNCQQITNTLDSVLTKAAKNIGNDVTLADLQKVYNIYVNCYSLDGIHDITVAKEKEHGCFAFDHTKDALETAKREISQKLLQQQNQGMEM